MRKIIWFTLGFGAVCCFRGYDSSGFLLLPVAALLGALLSGNRKAGKTLLVILGLAAGLCWNHRFETTVLQPIAVMDGLTGESEIRCTGYPSQNGYGWQVPGSLSLDGREYPVRLNLKEDPGIGPGSVLTGTFRFRLTTPGGEGASVYYRGEGIYLLASQEGQLQVSSGEAHWKDMAVRLRRQLAQSLEAVLTPSSAAFAKALLLGDTSGMDYEMKTQLTVSGIRHMVAVSGLHVSVLFSLLGFLALRNRFLSALFTVPGLLLFAAVTGFTPSVCRACIMCILLLAAPLVHREYDGPSALALSALILLLSHPLTAVSTGFQLSFASVAGIYLFSPRIHRWLENRLRKIRQPKLLRKLLDWCSLSVSITLGASITTTPLCALHFGTVSLVAPLTNLLVLWVVGILFYSLILVCLLFALVPGWTAIAGMLPELLIRFILLTAKFLASFPLACLYTRSPYTVLWLIFAYLLLGMFLLSSRKRTLIFSSCLLVSLCMALLASWLEPYFSHVRFTVLDVGQGQCLLLQSGGKNVMIDCGGSSDTEAADLAAETLLNQGIPELDALILTHSDRDHTGGAKYLLTRIGTRLLVLPPEPFSDLSGADQVLYAREEISLELESGNLRIFPGELGETGNENALCILFESPKCAILVTGDRSFRGEEALLRLGNLPEVDILVAGHHGGADSTGETLLKAVNPRIVCISAGSGNINGHPAPELLERLASFGCGVYRTDLQGEIIIRR